MHSFIMKITHSLPAKDTIAVVRGMYKVVEGGMNTQRVDNVDAKLKHSWHTKLDTQVETQNKPTVLNNQNPSSQFHPSQNQFKPSQNQQKSSENLQSSSHKFYSTQQATTSQSGIHTKINDQASNKFNQKPQHTQKNYKQLLKEVKQHTPKPQVQNKLIVQSKVPSSRVSRIFQFTKLGLNIAQSAVQAYFTKNDGKDHSATYEKIANKITDELCKMRGAPLKLAQMLSIQEDKLIPTPIRKAFEKARQTAHILPTEEVLYMMKKNYGNEWQQKFIRFDEKPFASASIGQVHLATLPTRQDVAIKIQYPGVRKSIESDISNLGLLMKIPGVFPKGMYMDRILKNTQIELTQQCDYILQKQKQQAYEECLKLCLQKDANFYKVPKVFDQFTTEEVFISEYLPGVSLKDIEEGEYPQQIKDEIGRRIMELTFNELFQMGIVQSDPNPANFTYNFQQDQLNLFDFGATHIYKRNFLEDYYKIIEGAVIQNNEQIWKSSIETGFLTGEESAHMKDSHIGSILIIGQPLRFKGSYDFGCQKITQKIYKTIPVMLKNRLKHPPEEVYSLHRKLSGSYLACMRLKARIDCSKIWEQIKFKRLIERIDLSHKSKLVI